MDILAARNLCLYAARARACALGCLGTLIAMVAAGGCAAAPQQRATADFESVMAAPERSNSVYLVGEDERHAVMERVLVGPNVAFESSRSSRGEPATQGPVGSEAPAIGDALGAPVHITLSSLMLKYLSMRESEVIVPVVTHRWAARACEAGKRACGQGTWVERLLLEARARQRVRREVAAGRAAVARDEAVAEKADGDTAELGDAVEVEPERAVGDAEGGDEDAPLPTVALAVRRLGVVYKEVGVVVERLDGGEHFAVRPRSQAPARRSVCPGETLASVPVPALEFSAELVDPADGRVIARLHEVERVPENVVDLEVPVSWRSFADEASIETQCAAVREAYEQEIARPLRAAVRAELVPFFGPVIAGALGPLYP